MEEKKRKKFLRILVRLKRTCWHGKNPIHTRTSPPLLSNILPKEFDTVTAWPPTPHSYDSKTGFRRRRRFREKKISREEDFTKRRFREKKISREEDFARKKFREKEISWEDPGDWNRLNDDSIQSSYQSNAIQAIELSSKAVVLAFSLVHQQLIFWLRACVRAHKISLCWSTHTVMKKNLHLFYYKLI